MSGVEIVRDGRTGWLVTIDGHPQSHVDLHDPLDLAFEYVALIGAAVEAVLGDRERVRATHVGGGGLTLPRWVQARWPGSPQIVLEPDAGLTALVRARLPLPRGHRIRVREVDGASGLRRIATASADLAVVDAYAGGRVPSELGAVPFLTDCARVLAPEGLLVLNLADEANGRYVDRVAAGLVSAGLSRPLLLATTDVLKRRRFGNRVVLASAGSLDTVAIDRAVRRLPWPARLDSPRPATAFTDDAEASPPPPPVDGSWRVR